MTARARFACLVAMLVALPGAVSAQDASAPADSGSADSGERGVGNTLIGLSGFHRVGVVTVRKPELVFSGTTGYGYTEAQDGEDGAHHRIRGALGIGLRPIDWLAFALSFDGRYDTHPDDGLGETDDGWVGDPRLHVRAGTALGSVRLGAELGLWFPGSDAPSIVFDATSVELAALLGFNPAGSGLTIGLKAGYRLDRSAESIDDASRLRQGDRLALGLSDSDAVLIGVGAGYRADAVELLGELTWDLLLGSSAPSATESPLRGTVGGRYHIGELALELLADVGLSSRPSSAPGAALVPIEPRFTVLLGLRYALGLAGEPAPAPPRDEVTAPPVTPTTTVRGRVVDAAGEAVSGATVEIEAGNETQETTTGADGAYAFENVPVGPAVLIIVADGFVAARKELSLDGTVSEQPPTALEPAKPDGQLRGLIRTFSGEPLTATIRVSPIEVETTTDEEGRFEIDVPPGQYEVSIEAEDHASQTRSVTVEENGVTVLNAELRRGD